MGWLIVLDQNAGSQVGSCDRNTQTIPIGHMAWRAPLKSPGPRTPTPTRSPRFVSQQTWKDPTTTADALVHLQGDLRMCVF